MTPKEKAEELVIKFLKLTSKHKGLETAGQGAIHLAKQCALIAVDEIINYLTTSLDVRTSLNAVDYWREVKKELNIN